MREVRKPDIRESPHPERRIASLLPSATEIVCALGLEDQLVGVTHECDYPPSVQRKPVLTRSALPKAGTSAAIDRHVRRLVHEGSSIYALEAGRLKVLRPDLILTQELCEVCAVSYPIAEQAARRLDATTQLISLEPETLADVFDHVRLVGRLTGRGPKADSVVADLQRRIDAVRTAVAGRPPRRLVVLEWLDPPFNCGHWTPGLVEMAGGRDLLGTPGRPARPLTWARLAETRPDVIVVAACGFSLERSLREVDGAEARLFEAAQSIWVMDGNAYLSRPGPRLVDSVEILAGILHPDVMPAPSAAAARRRR